MENDALPPETLEEEEEEEEEAMEVSSSLSSKMPFVNNTWLSPVMIRYAKLRKSRRSCAFEGIESTINALKALFFLL